MKNVIYVVLICLAIVPAYAQNAADQDRHTEDKITPALVRAYADRVNGLLRDIDATLQRISEGVEAGELTPQQARTLKLTATRAMIARLETISAVYDAKTVSKDSVEARGGFIPGSDSAADSSVDAELSAKSTVSVQELKRESGR